MTVANSGGTSTTGPADRYTYVAPGQGPTVTGLEPPEGPTTGATYVTVTGKNFIGVTAVDFGTVPASSFTVASKSSLTAVSPAEGPGTVNVTVVTPNGASPSSKKNVFTFTGGALALGQVDDLTATLSSAID